MKQLLETSNRILVGGHRGCLRSYQENTQKAMEEGIARGADYLEIDVQFTKDNQIVIYHDTCLEDKLKLIGSTSDYTLDALRKYTEINTLDEILAWGKSRSLYFGLELKEVPVQMQELSMKMLPSLIRCIKKYEMLQNVFVFGADYQVLKALKELEKQLMIGIIVPFVPYNPVALMQEMDASIYISYVYNLTPNIVKNLKDNGYYVNGSTLNTNRCMELALSLGVNMIEVDDPYTWKEFLLNKNGK